MDKLSRPLELCHALDELREESWAQLGVKYAAIEISKRVKILLHFILSLAPNDGGTEPTDAQILAVRLSLLAFHATKGTEISNIFQLQAAIASIRRNSLIVAGTGFGKTHIMALLMLLEKLESKKVFITVSPLKRLQVTQVTSFLLKYGIKTLSINHDTSKSVEYWRTNIHDGRKGQSQQGTARHLIVTAEQLFKSPEGHLTQFALTLRNFAFRQRITRVNVDEFHFIHYAGIERFGIPPFRSAWGRFSELKMTLPKSVLWNGYTATCPPHVQNTIETALMGSDYTLLQRGINRPTIIYARHCVVKNFQLFENYLCFLQSPFPDNGTHLDQPRVLIFFDSNTLAQQVAKYLSHHAPAQFQGSRFVQHYYSMMSPLYLERVHNEFTHPDGPCRILCATSGESTGVDFPDVQITVNVGIIDKTESDQQKGRCDRRLVGGLHLILYEPWVLDIKLTEFENKELPFSNDPDHPRMMLKSGSNKHDRIPQCGVECILAPCVREHKANYFADTSLSCIDYTTFCCDGSKHENDTIKFILQDHLPGPLYAPITVANGKACGKRGAIDDEPNAELDEEDNEEAAAAEIMIEVGTETAVVAKKKIRVARFKKPLLERLFRWRKSEHEKDPISAVLPEYLMINDDALTALSKVHPMDMQSPATIIAILDEEPDGDIATLWAQKIFDIIFAFDTQHPATVKKSVTRKRQRCT